ncbi:MAG: porphobilinogen synthase [Rhodospirillaceae bacterium]|nr:porphobilinogen synthase [Rhodospirillaceae bacterium]
MAISTFSFPETRLRRWRAADWRRRLFRETVLTENDLVLPLFVVDGNDTAIDIPSLPDVQRLSVDRAVKRAREAYEAGIPAIALFPATDPKLKDARGTEALNADNLVCRSIKAIKAAVPDIGVIADVALDPYTDHGHDGIIADGDVANDETVAILIQQAVVLAEAGAGIVAPSDMMDGRIGAIRKALEAHKHVNTLILSYAVKYASAFYGPFRDAVGSGGRLGAKSGPSNKRSYQMDPANTREADREAAMDVNEGADALMVKPAGTSLDIIANLHRDGSLPVFAYQVSGEYAMLAVGAANGLFNRTDAFMESLVAIKRAGATGILTYAALDIARALKDSRP